ncbi:MAG: redoxin domain-containing protein [bacterium]|nr:redoxin domain-containing protein [bacterium]
MYPHERSLVERHKDAPFALIGVNSDRDLDAIRAVAAAEGLGWRNFWDGRNGPIATAWQVRAWPTIYLIDHEGRIRFENVRGDALDTAIDQLLAEVR